MLASAPPGDPNGVVADDEDDDNGNEDEKEEEDEGGEASLGEAEPRLSMYDRRSVEAGSLYIPSAASAPPPLPTPAAAAAV